MAFIVFVRDTVVVSSTVTVRVPMYVAVTNSVKVRETNFVMVDSRVCVSDNVIVSFGMKLTVVVNVDVSFKPIELLNRGEIDSSLCEKVFVADIDKDRRMLLDIFNVSVRAV